MQRSELDDESLDGSTALIAISGELDLHAIGDLRRRVDAAFEGGRRHLVLDLTAVIHMDSSGLAELISCHQRALGLDGGLALVVASEAIRRTLEIRGVKHLFTIAGSRQEAVAALSGA
jgi:anti-anti-sigma factor